MERTKPRHHKIKEIPIDRLAHGRYGTVEMGEIFGPEKTFEYSLIAQAAAIKALREVAPDVISAEHTEELVNAANLKRINPERIREIEDETGHDIWLLIDWGP